MPYNKLYEDWYLCLGTFTHLCIAIRAELKLGICVELPSVSLLLLFRYKETINIQYLRQKRQYSLSSVSITSLK